MNIFALFYFIKVSGFQQYSLLMPLINTVCFINTNFHCTETIVKRLFPLRKVKKICQNIQIAVSYLKITMLRAEALHGVTCRANTTHDAV